MLKSSIGSLDIHLIDPYLAGSHAQWANSFQKYSRHDIEVLGLPGKYWKWRMHGSAVEFAEQYKSIKKTPDLFLVSDMLDLATFKGLAPQWVNQIPFALYFHENQLGYPENLKSDPDKHFDRHYGFINYTSALAADLVCFNSRYHLEQFFEDLLSYLKVFPDRRNLQNIDRIRDKSKVLPLALALEEIQQFPEKERTEKKKNPVILWNHRWEYDKGPDLFFNCLFELATENIPFELIILGESFQRSPAIFDEAVEILGTRIIHIGYAGDRKEYIRLLHLADILPATSLHDFFGVSVVEAIAANCYPLLPNALAYPEHLPEMTYNDHLYQDPKEMKTKLIWACRNVDVIREMPIRNWVDKYDWSVLIDEYDRQFEKLYSQGRPDP